MTPRAFGQKLAAELSPQPMVKALDSQAKLFPHMVNMARASGKNQINALNSFSHAVKVRTGEHPSNWEMYDALSAPNTGYSQVPSMYPKK